MNLVFSPGWLYLFLLILALCVWRIIVKAGTIHRESRMDARVFHIEPFTPDEKSPLPGDHGADIDAITRAEEELLASLRRHPADTDARKRARVLLNLGRLYRDLAARRERRSNLIKAAQAYYEGSTLSIGDDPLKRSLMGGLGDSYRDLAPVHETRECLTRALQAYALAIKPGPGDNPILFAELCEGFSQAAVSLAGITEREENLGRAARALRVGLAALDEEEHADLHRRLRERLVEVELG